jgi:benzoyl-CoA reductase/2-hydroxyglutaryl-CoA dehydratase subunit BcrC/BadD/HgdB
MRVFLTSPWIPAEWIRAHGLTPGGIWSDENFSLGTMALSAGVCAFAEAAVRFAEAQEDSAVIFSTACDQMRRCFDTALLHGQCRAFLFNLPATQTPAAKQIYRAELERLGQFLLTIGGRAPSPERLRQEMLQSSATRKRLLESAPASSPRGFAEAVTQFHWDGTFSPSPPAAQTDQVPLALVGGPFLVSHWKLLDEIEAVGGRVVLNATKTGERSLCPAFESEAATDHPFDALVRGYCDNIVDVFQRPNTRLYSWLKPRLASRQVRGIVLWHFTGCDLWRAEAQTLRETFSLPVLLLEASDEPGNSPRELTRLQAFVETLERARPRAQQRLHT